MLPDVHKGAYPVTNVYRCYDDVMTWYRKQDKGAVCIWNEVESIDNTPKDEVMPLWVYINSEGGDLDAALSIISVMQSSKIPVYTHVYGRAWSSAFFIALCGA